MIGDLISWIVYKPFELTAHFSAIILQRLIKQYEFKVHVTTGDRLYAGTDSTVYIQLVDTTGAITEPECLDRLLVNDHERGETHSYEVSSALLRKPESLDHIVIWRDSSGFGDAWFLDRIEVEELLGSKRRFIYPVQRWIKADQRYYLYQYDAFLPQDDPQPRRRKLEIEEKRCTYQFDQKIKGPKQLKQLPPDEEFSLKYMLDFVKLKGKLTSQNQLIRYTTELWESLEHLKNIFVSYSDMHQPVCVDHWKEDKWFGLQRVQGVNPVLIRLCKEIPHKFAVTPEMVEPFLEGFTLANAISERRIFIIDLEILTKVQCKNEKVLVIPLALFYRNNDDDLLPIAIQLFQKPGPDNPVYLPSDPPYTWLMAKMFYNMGDAQHHQSSTHLGLTHLLMETMCVATHRHLSPSHPIFRLLAPHFLYLLAINERGLKKLVQPGGWVDTGMTVGVCGMYKLIKKGYRSWNLNIHGDVEKELEHRGVLDPAVLPVYPYRDDAVPLYKIIKRYVHKVVHYYYNSANKLEEDWEIHAWVKEMALPQDEEGLGVGGMPMHLDNIDQLVQICTTIVSTCSLGHAAANFQQYDAYGFVPNYPGILIGLPPKRKREMTPEDILKFLPDKGKTLDIMVITKLLSMKGTQSLGDFEVQYHYDPKVVHMADEFRLELKKLSHFIKERNKTSKHKYKWLDPEIVPNSISI